MSKRGPSPQAVPVETPMELSHLRRGSRTALELAIIALAPSELVDRLATAAGLLEALAELPSDSAPVVAILPRASKHAQNALEEWQKWHHEHLEGKLPRV